MKNSFKIYISIAVIAIIASCSNNNDIDAKKAKLEKLKAQKVELSDKIKTLEDEIAHSGDTSKSLEKMKDVMVTKLEPSQFIHSIDVQGRVEGDENITISTKMAGTITKVNVVAGSSVKAGEIMAEIENDAMRSQLADLQSSYDLSKDIYNRQKTLWEQKVGTEIQYLQAKNNKESLEQKIEQVKRTLDMYYVKAPFNGTVDEVTIKLGQTVSPGISAIRVVNLNKLKVRADLAEAYSARIETGNTVNLVFPDINKTATSKVTYIAKVINALTRSFNVEIALPTNEDYRPNMIAQVSIVDYTNDKAIVVPVNAVQNIDDKNYVFVALDENGKKVARKREVIVGDTYTSWAEIKTGLQAGELLITTGYSNLNDGQLIKF
jgi:membrane fusion protein, multidrug efflux system